MIGYIEGGLRCNENLTTAQRQLVELNKHIIGQDDAKRALIRLTSCADMRIKVEGEIKEAIRPFHAILHGPTGSGKSALVEFHAQNDIRPYIKTEATRYTEVGYVGRDVESMIRDLVDNAIYMVRKEEKKKFMERATSEAKARIVDVLTKDDPSEENKKIFMKKLEDKSIDDREIEIEIQDNPKAGGGLPLDLMGGGGGVAHIGVMNFGDFLKGMGKKNTKVIVVPVKEAMEILLEEILSGFMDEDKIVREAMKLAENRGIIFIDEIDKIASRAELRRGGEVNREGVQRDLLPLLDGTIVHTKYGTIKTHHILFIAAGAFHNAKLSDLLPELQGRFPVRVKLNALTYNDFVRILRDTKYSLLKQYTSMLATKDVELHFSDSGIEAIAAMTVALNESENTGARRLRTVIDKVLHDITFDPELYTGKKVEIDGDFVRDSVRDMRDELDLSRFIL